MVRANKETGKVNKAILSISGVDKMKNLGDIINYINDKIYENAGFLLENGEKVDVTLREIGHNKNTNWFCGRLINILNQRNIEEEERLDEEEEKEIDDTFEKYNSINQPYCMEHKNENKLIYEKYENLIKESRYRQIYLNTDINLMNKPWWLGSITIEINSIYEIDFIKMTGNYNKFFNENDKNFRIKYVVDKYLIKGKRENIKYYR